MFPLCLGPARNSTILVIFSPPIFPLENSVRLASRGFPFSNHRNTGRGLDSPAKQRQTKHYITTVYVATVYWTKFILFFCAQYYSFQPQCSAQSSKDFWSWVLERSLEREKKSFCRYQNFAWFCYIFDFKLSMWYN